jgi:heme o synthase
MSTNLIVAAIDGYPTNNFSDYWALAKPEVNFLIGITAASAFTLGSSAAGSHFSWLPLVSTVVGTLLVAGGAGALNQWLEHRFDAKMRRTARRPIAAGRVQPAQALAFGAILSVTGVLYLALALPPAACILALLTLGWYLLLYTPLKRRTHFCTLVGVFPGAMPVLIGYVAAAGKLDTKAWLLYAILLLWQFPHFMAIAWMYREDYDRAGYLILPKGDRRFAFVTWQTVLPLVILTPLTLFVAPAAAAIPLSLGFLYYGARFAIRKSSAGARKLLFASIVYLPALFGLAVLVRM